MYTINLNNNARKWSSKKINASTSSSTSENTSANTNESTAKASEDFESLMKDLPTILDDNLFEKLKLETNKSLAEYVAQFINKDLALRILRAFENSHGLIQAAIDSFNHLMNHIIPEIIYEKRELFTENPRKLEKISFRIEHVHIEKPTIEEDNGSMKAIYPNEARLRRITYAASIYICFQYNEYHRNFIHESYILKRSVRHKNKLVCKVPVMVKSHFCNLVDYPEHFNQECLSDPGGYFIISGTEKAIIMQLKRRTNFPFVQKNNSNERYNYTCEIRSLPEGKMRSTSTLYVDIAAQKGDTPPSVIIRMPFVTFRIPLYTMFRLLRVQTVFEMMTYIFGSTSFLNNSNSDSNFNNNINLQNEKKFTSWLQNQTKDDVLKPNNGSNCSYTSTRSDSSSSSNENDNNGSYSSSSSLDSFFKTSQMIHYVSSILTENIHNTHKMNYEEILQYVSKLGTNQLTPEQQIRTMQHLIANEFLPHMGTDPKNPEIYRLKAIYLGYIVRKLLLAQAEKIELDDRDDCRNNRIEPPGPLIGLLFRQIYGNYIKILLATLHRGLKGKPLNINQILNSRKLSAQIQYPFATGNWTIQKGSSAQTGVAQVLSRVTQSGMLSHLRRINTPLSREGKLPKPRQLNKSHWNITCPSETPEGESCGLMQNLSYTAHIRINKFARNDHYYFSNTPNTPNNNNNNTNTLPLTSPNVPTNHVLVPFNHSHYIAQTLYDLNDAFLSKSKKFQLYDFLELEVVPIIQCSIQDIYAFENTRIFINGSLFGVFVSKKLQQLYKENSKSFLFQKFRTVPRQLILKHLHNLRALGALPRDTSIVLAPEYLEKKYTNFSKRNNPKPYIYNEEMEDDFNIYELWISTDTGEPSRPVFNLTKIHLLNSVIEDYRNYPSGLYDALFTKGIIQYMGKDEERMYYIAPSLKHLHEFADDLVPSLGKKTKIHYTHLELHPCGILGLCVNLIPFPDENQAPRNMYEASMQKQRISFYPLNHMNRYYMLSYCLHYGQKPLVSTFLDDFINASDVPSTSNPIVAVMAGGTNVEDAIIANQSSIDRGLFDCDIFRSYREEESRKDGPKFHQINPNDRSILGLRANSYDALEEDGLPAVGAIVQNNDALIGKWIIPSVKDSTEYNYKKDLSICVKTNETCQVSGVVRTVGKNDKRMVIVKTRAKRSLQIGDKLCSMHGQKGTLGETRRQEDMPFTSEGIVPDLIVNVHGFPSRMTLGQQLEMLLGKAICVSDKMKNEKHEYENINSDVDGTAFTNEFNWNEPDSRKEAIYQYLHERGYQKHGNETMYCGITGEKLDANIFIAPVCYQRLRHMVLDKNHARSRGPCTLLTRQPTEGRSRDGGLRFGEMESQNMISHGSSEVLKDRLFEQSDAFKVHFCKICGLLAESKTNNILLNDSNGNNNNNNNQNQTQTQNNNHDLKEIPYCRNCDCHDHIIEKEIPYATKLLFQELYALHISPRVVF